MTPSHLPRVLFLAGLATWVGVCLATALGAHQQSALRIASWMAASTLYIGCFLWNARRATPSFVVLGIQSASVIAMVSLMCSGYEGLLLVLSAAQLALHASQRTGLVWIGVQTLVLAIAIALHWSPPPALMLAFPYLGFQVLMFVGLRLFVDERQARQRLSDTHDTLLRLQQELAQKARVEERLRIAQEMHDVLGHHLAALSLNLELAVHASQEATRETIRTAQSLARALLLDVKAMVRSADDEVPVDLPKEMRQLAQDLPRPQLHITCTPELRILDPRASRALLRVIQEIITNSIRHGRARNLWITLEQSDHNLTLVARDDGDTDAYGAVGFGLSGMRRRLEGLGGTLDAAPAATGGFEVRAALPNLRGVAA